MVEDFEYDKEGNQYVGRMELNRNSGEKYQAKSSDCKRCALKETCIVSRGGKMREKIDKTTYRE
jgi:transcriptional antiterminator Rof (Rho-off)